MKLSEQDLRCIIRDVISEVNRRVTSKRSASGWTRTNAYGDEVKRGGSIRNEYGDEPDSPDADYSIRVVPMTRFYRAGAHKPEQKKKKYTVEGPIEWSYYFNDLEDFVKVQTTPKTYSWSDKSWFPETEKKVATAVAEHFGVEPAELIARISKIKRQIRSKDRIR